MLYDFSVIVSFVNTDFAFEELQRTFSKYDLKRLELYSRQMADHHLITDLLPKC